MSPNPKQKNSFITDFLFCANCFEVIPELKTYPCGLLLCDECQSFPSQKRFKCSTCNSYHFVPNINQINEPDNEPNKLMTEIDKKLFELRSTLLNGDDLIREKSIELRRQVQLAKEQQIEHIESTATQMLNKINDYEKKALDKFYYDNYREYKSKIDKIEQQLDEWNTKLIDLKTSQNKNHYKKLQKLKENIYSSNLARNAKLSDLVFKNSNILTFKKAKINTNILGNLKEKPTNNIKYEHLIKIDYGKYFYKFNLIALKEIMYNYGKQFEFNIMDTKLLPNNDLLVLAEYLELNNFQDSLFLIKIDLDGNWKRHIRLKTLVDLNYVSIDINLKLFVSNNRICLNYHSNSEDLIQLFDFDLNVIKELKLLIGNKRVIGVNDYKIFILSKELDGNHPIEVYNWNLDYEDSLGQTNDQGKPFYIPEHCKHLFTCESLDQKRYLIIQSRNEVRIVDLKSGNARLIRERNVIKCDFDSNENLILFRKEKLAYFDLNGQFVKDVKLGDLKYKLNGEFFYLNCDKSDLYYFDSECFVFSFV